MFGVRSCADSWQHCHRGIPDRSEFWQPRNLGYQFLAEAKRLWELAQDDGKLTTAQAGMLISATCNANGVDKIGWPYLVQAVKIANELELFAKNVATTNRKSRLSRVFTAWCLFSYQW